MAVRAIAGDPVAGCAGFLDGIQRSVVAWYPRATHDNNNINAPKIPESGDLTKLFVNIFNLWNYFCKFNLIEHMYIFIL